MPVIDVHNHYTTVPAALNVYRAGQSAAATSPPFKSSSISDDAIIASVKEKQIAHMAIKGIDRLIFSPQAGAMGHQFGGS